MKISFDAKRAFLNSSGLGNYSRNTLMALRQYHPENEYLLFTPEIRVDLFGQYSQFKIISPQNTVVKKLSSVWRSFFLVSLAKRHDTDIFHGLSNELPKGIRKSGIRSVVTIHDVVFMRYPEFYTTVDRKIYFKKVRYACKSATKIIAISKQTRADLITFFKVPRDKIELIYQPVSSVFFEKQDIQKIRSRYDLPEQFILVVGTLEPRKNQMSLLKAIKSAGIDKPVILIGKATPYLSRLRQYVSENNMIGQVTFLSNIPEKDLAGIYQCATLSVYISVFEGFGLPVIEAMASGCPVITSNISVLPETAGKAAVLCSPSNYQELGQKISLLLHDVHFRNSMTEKGYERAKLFHPEIYAKKLNDLYHTMMNEYHATGN